MTRYQSYCTLPRPEDPLDTENLVAAHLATQQSQSLAAQQQNVFYVPFQTYSMPPLPPSAATLPRPPPQSSLPIPHSSLPIPVSLPPPPPPDFRPPVHFINAQPDSSPFDLVPWEGIQLLGYMHILLSICIFSAGGYRITQGAKWAMGVEMVYAILVLSNAFLGIIAATRRRLHAIVAHFVFSSFNLLLAAPPIILGLMPWFAENHLSINPKWFISETEPFSVDYCLAVLVMIEAFISGLTVVMGCRCIGNALETIVQLRNSNEEQRPTKC